MSVGSYPEIQQYNFSVELNSIDYEQQTLRIFDPGVQKNNCSTLPVYPLSPDHDYYSASYGMDIDRDAGWLVFVSCKNRVKLKSPLYVDTASCNITANHFSKMNAQSDYYSYVVIGKNVVASDIEESCTIHKIVRADLRCLPKVTGDISFQDIHNALANGFELSLSTRSTLRRSILYKYTNFADLPCMLLSSWVLINSYLPRKVEGCPFR